MRAVRPPTALRAVGALLLACLCAGCAPAAGGPELLFAGDILLAGGAERLVQDEGPAAPFADLLHLLRSSDLTIGNLECALATGGRPVEKMYTFRAAPRTAAALAAAGFDIIGLANNHAGDFGPEALLETIAALQRHGIAPVGAGRERADARRFLLVECGSPPMTVALLAFSNMLPKSLFATRTRPGTNPAYGDAMREDIGRARAEADFVVVLFHWGDELGATPSQKQRRVAAIAADAGADLVVGAHPHVLQGLELRGRTLIAYSLGNFLFPSRGDCRLTALLRCRPGRDGSARVELTPCVVEGFRPRLADGDERGHVLARLRRLSAALGCSLDGSGGLMLPSRAASVDKAQAGP